MGCTHEMKSGSVVTVINAGGIAGGCSFCKTDALEARVAQLETTLARVAEWTRTFGAELKPRRADTYGEGVRDSKERVAAIINAAMVTGGTDP